MTDSNNRNTLKEAFDAELMKRLEENPPEIPTYEEFSAMVDKSLAERCRRRKRIAGIAAGFVVVLLAGILACTNLTTDVDADKNPKEEIITEDGVIIEDGGWGSSEEADNVRIIADWALVEKEKEIVPELLIPGYIPEGYEFEKLTIEVISENATICKYLYDNNKNQTFELQFYNVVGGESSLSIGNITSTVECLYGTIFFQGAEKEIATIQIDNGEKIINIINLKSVEDTIRIIEGLRF